MAIQKLESDRAAKTLARKGWSYEATFRTPLQDLNRFCGVIGGSIDGLASADAHIVEELFAAQRVIDLCQRDGLALETVRGCSLHAPSAVEAVALLEACLGCWVDFWWVPSTKAFVVYADHDEYMTVLSARKRGLTDVCAALEGAGFVQVDYVRERFK